MDSSPPLYEYLSRGIDQCLSEPCPLQEQPEAAARVYQSPPHSAADQSLQSTMPRTLFGAPTARECSVVAGRTAGRADRAPGTRQPQLPPSTVDDIVIDLCSSDEEREAPSSAALKPSSDSGIDTMTLDSGRPAARAATWAPGGGVRVKHEPGSAATAAWPVVLPPNEAMTAARASQPVPAPAPAPVPEPVPASECARRPLLPDPSPWAASTLKVERACEADLPSQSRLPPPSKPPGGGGGGAAPAAASRQAQGPPTSSRLRATCSLNTRGSITTAFLMMGCVFPLSKCQGRRSLTFA